MKKLGIVLASVLVACFVGVIIYFVIPKGESYNLTLDANDIVVKVGEIKKLEFECSIDEAFVSASVEDATTAKVYTADRIKVVSGCKFGKTKLTITAKYKSQTESTVVDITVIAGDPVNKETPGDGVLVDDEKRDPLDLNPNKDANGGGLIENPSDEENKVLNLIKVMNCEINDDKIVVTDKLAILLIDREDVSEIRFEFDKSKLDVSLDENNALTLKVKALEIGEHYLKVIINNIEYCITIDREV